MEAFALIPVFIGIVFVLVIGGIIFAVVKGIGTWASNNEQPVLALPAKVVSKRTNTSGGAGDSAVSTWYYATFQMEDGERKEFGVSGHEYGLLAEGDAGTLTSQGTRYKGFVRSAA